MNAAPSSPLRERGVQCFALFLTVAYFTLQALEALIPPADLTKALDDDADGIADAFAIVEAQASGAVDALLSGRFGVPFTGDVPTIVSQAAKIFAAELCYKRRGVSDEANPWFNAADAMRKQLTKIGLGEAPLTPTVKATNPAGTVIKEPASTFASGGGRMI